MHGIGFVLKVRPDLLEDYKRHHQAVWPEMLYALRRSGWHNYTLFLQPDGTLFGYFETEGGLEEVLAGHADQMMEALDEVFHLD
jgi:L-rhamnose mutarotase